MLTLLLSTPKCWEAVVEGCHPARAPRETGIRSSRCGCRHLFAAAVAALVVDVDVPDELVAVVAVAGYVAKSEAARAASCPKEPKPLVLVQPLALALDSARQQ